LEILTDVKAKEAYDRTRKAKQVNEARIKKLDSKRRKFREDLERREKEAKDSAIKTAFDSSQVADEELLKKEIDRLKKEGSRALQEEQELIRQQILKEQQEKMSFLHVVNNVIVDEASEKLKPKIKIKWSSSVVIDEAKLRNIFEKYGEITNLIVIKRSALVEFISLEVANKAYEIESVKSDLYQWKFEWVSKPSQSVFNNNNDNSSSASSSSYSSANVEINPLPPPAPISFRPPTGPPTSTSFADFEAMILGKLSDAAKAQTS
jgi:DnaJ family protein C protein 17